MFSRPLGSVSENEILRPRLGLNTGLYLYVTVCCSASTESTSTDGALFLRLWKYRLPVIGDSIVFIALHPFLRASHRSPPQRAGGGGVRRLHSIDRRRSLLLVYPVAGFALLACRKASRTNATGFCVPAWDRSAMQSVMRFIACRTSGAIAVLFLMLISCFLYRFLNCFHASPSKFNHPAARRRGRGLV